MPFDYNHQSTNANPGSTPRPEGARATGADQQQEAPARENPEPLGSGAYPGAVPSFFPYTQYPGLTWQPRSTSLKTTTASWSSSRSRASTRSSSMWKTPPICC